MVSRCVAARIAGAEPHMGLMQELQENYAALYGELHKNDKRFPGSSIRVYVDELAELVKETGAQRLLDYGSGKGYQYLVMRVHERWGGILPHCYDVGVRQLSKRPEGVFTGIICTDVMEHIAERDVDAILADIFSFSDRSKPSFVLFGISIRPSAREGKKLPDGRPVHLTVRPPDWWERKLKPFKRDGLTLHTRYEGDSVCR